MSGIDLVDALPARTGHFRFESGHHGDFWLVLDALFTDPDRTEQLAAEVTGRLGGRGIELVCGPMTGGALLAQVVARQLGVAFAYTERVVAGDLTVRYILPVAQQPLVRGERVAIVDDVINAGSATTKSFDALVSAGARPVAITALLVLGSAIDRFGEHAGIEVIACSRRESALWSPEDCPLCAQGVPFDNLP